ncbi:MAG TPA: low temperature requirement protein A [Gaiellaceae bacterium]|nr:low temperature requirement protein A [Gaiellaceae bacterium]
MTLEAAPDRAVRVSTLELFFDLVFVFTITQLTGVLVGGEGAAAVAQVVVMLLLIWWMYDGYAWLTNAIATERLRVRLLLIGGMAGFLVIALAIPDAYDGDGLAFGLGYLVVVFLHAVMYARGASVSEVRAILRIVPFNLAAVALVLVGGALGGDAQWIIWTLVGALLWVTPSLTTVEGFVIAVSHFVERHALVVIVALGESIVVIGAGAAGLSLDGGLVLVALLSLTLSAALWWLYFSDETAIEHALHGAPPEQRPQLALIAFGYWHYGILLGVVAVAAGLKKAIGDPYDPLGGWIAVGLAVGVSLFIACDVGFRRTLGLALNQIRLVACVATLLTIPLGTELGAAAQVGAIAALVAAALVVEALRAERFIPGRLPRAGSW